MWERRLAAMLALYTSKGVAPEVNLRERILRTPLPSANKAEPTLALKPRGDVTRSPKKGVSVAPQMDMCPTKIYKKKREIGSIYSNGIIDTRRHKRSNHKAAIAD